MRTTIVKTDPFTYRNVATGDVWYGVTMSLRQRWSKGMSQKQVTFKLDAIRRPDGHIVFKRLLDGKLEKPKLYDIVPVARFIEGLDYA